MAMNTLTPSTPVIAPSKTAASTTKERTDQVSYYIRKDKLNDLMEVLQFTNTERDLFLRYVQTYEYWQQLTHPVASGKLAPRLSERQQSFVNNLSTQQLVVHNPEDQDDLILLAFSRPWINKKEEFVAIHDLIKFGKMELIESFQTLSELKKSYSEEDLTHKLNELSFLAKTLGSDIKQIFSSNSSISFYKHADILFSLLKFACNFKDAQALIEEISSKSKAGEILKAVEFLLSTDKLTNADKGDFVNLMISKRNRFKVEDATQLKERVARYEDFGFRRFMDELRDGQKPTNEYSEKKTSVQTPISGCFFYNSEKLLNGVMEDYCLSLPEVILAQQYFYQQTQKDKFNSDAGVFCDWCKKYPLNELQIGFIQSQIATIYSEPGEIQKKIRGRPWLNTEQHFEALKKLMNVAEMSLSDSLKVLTTVQRLYDGENLQYQLKNLIYLVGKFGSRIKEILPNYPFAKSNKSANFYKHADILCSLVEVGYDFDAAVKMISEIGKELAAGMILEVIPSLIQQPGAKEHFCELVKEPWFKFWHLTFLPSLINEECDFANAVKVLENLIKESPCDDVPVVSKVCP